MRMAVRLFPYLSDQVRDILVLRVLLLILGSTGRMEETQHGSTRRIVNSAQTDAGAGTAPQDASYSRFGVGHNLLLELEAGILGRAVLLAQILAILVDSCEGEPDSCHQRLGLAGILQLGQLEYEDKH